MDEALLSFLRRLAKALAAQFGPNCEVVVHDLCAESPESSIVCIENGHVTGRTLGDGPSQVVLDALSHQGSTAEDRLCYLTRTKDGRILKSTTVYIRNEAGRAVGIFSLNYDITLMLSMEESLRQFTAVAPKSRDAAPEPIYQNVSDLLDELIAQSLKQVGKPPALMTREDRVKAIRFLNDTGAFLITRSGDRVCSCFGISKYTLYSCLEEIKNGK